MKHVERESRRLAASKVSWNTLTRDKQKEKLYTGDPGLREAWLHLDDMFGHDFNDILTRTATVIIKPEAIVSHRLRVTLNYLEQHGYSPVAAQPLHFNRQMAMALWQYQWNKATVDRVELHTLMLGGYPSLLIVLQDRRPQPNIPASVRLWGLKGASVETRREPHHLRSVLGMNNRMIGFVHTADEPADILREQGLFYDTKLREQLWRDVAINLERENSFNALKLGQEIESTAITHPVSLEDVVDKLSRSSRPGVSALLSSLANGEKCLLSNIRERFGSMESADDEWDFFVLAASLIEFDVPGVAPTLDALSLPITLRKWERP